MSTHGFNVHQGDAVVASVTSGDRRNAFRAAMFLAIECADEGPCIVRGSGEFGDLLEASAPDVIVEALP